MSRITIEHNESSIISSFAYTTGKVIEEIIKNETTNLKDTNKLLEGKILGFYNLLQEPIKTQYANYFDIKSIKEGNI